MSGHRRSRGLLMTDDSSRYEQGLAIPREVLVQAAV